MVDFTSSTGNRTSRSPRSKPASFDTGTVRETSRDFARVQVAPRSFKAAGVAGAAKALADYFTTELALSTKKDVIQLKKDNAKEIARIEAEVQADRDGAREAIRTGDYSKFLPTDAARRNEVLVNSFQSVSAQVMAHQDYDDQLELAIASTPAGMDPDDTVELFLREKTKGGKPFWSQAYSKVIQRRSGKAVTRFRKGRLDALRIKAEFTGVELIRNDLESGAIAPTVEGLQEARRSLTGSLPMPGPDAILKGNALVDQTIINVAASGGPGYQLALKLMSIREKDRGDTSIDMRRRGALSAAIAKSLKISKSFTSVAAAQSISTMRDRLLAIQIGAPEDGDTVQSLIVDMFQHREKYDGEARIANPAWRRLMGGLVTQLGKSGFAAGSLARMADGHFPGVSNSDWNDMVGPLMNGSMTAKMMEVSGLNEADATNRIVQMVANRGSGKTLRETNSAVMASNGPAKDVQKVYDMVKTFADASGRPVGDLHLTGRAADIFTMMRWAESAGMDPMLARKNFMEQIDQTDGEVNPDTHFDDRFLRPGRKDSKRFTATGTASEGVTVWDDLLAPELEKQGWFTDSKPSYSDLPTNVTRLISLSINRASFLLGNTTSDVGAVRALASKLLQGKFGLSADANGKIEVSMERAPPLAVSRDGTTIPGARTGIAVIERAIATKDTPFVQSLLGMIGGEAAFRSDSRTSAGQGMSVRSLASGFETDVIVPAGGIIVIDAGDIPTNIPTAFFEQIKNENGQLFLKAPTAPAGGEAKRIYFDDNYFMLYDRNAGGWVMRWQDVGAPTKSLSELSDENAANRKSIPHSGHRQFVATLDEVTRAARQREAPVGSPVPTEDTAGPVTPEEADAVADAGDEVLDEAQAKGVISPLARASESNAFMDFIRNLLGSNPTVEDRLSDVMKHEKAQGGWLDDLSDPKNKQFLSSVSDFVEQSEGRVSYVYSDEDKKAWRKGAPGNPTVGIGFNLNRPDARKLLTQIGADLDDLKALRTTLNQGQENRLFALAMQEGANWLRSHFEGVDMANHRWMALMSLTYNSRWTDAGPTLIGPLLTRAIKDGNWQAAALEIELNSSGGVHHHLKKGILARRKREANMFLGTR